jgi:hypothetical protein
MVDGPERAAGPLVRNRGIGEDFVFNSNHGLAGNDENRCTDSFCGKPIFDPDDINGKPVVHFRRP